MISDRVRFYNKLARLQVIMYRQRTIKVKSMQRSGTEAIRTQIKPSKPKREVSKITNSQNTKNMVNRVSSYFPNVGNPKPNKNDMNTHKVKRHQNRQQRTTTNYHIGTVSNVLLGVGVG